MVVYVKSNGGGGEHKGGDCSIRAISEAISYGDPTSESYEAARALLRRHEVNGRRSRISFTWDAVRGSLRSLGYREVQVPRMTMKKFVDEVLPQCEYLVAVVEISRHVFAIVNGEQRDTWHVGPRRFVTGLWLDPDATSPKTGFWHLETKRVYRAPKQHDANGTLKNHLASAKRWLTRIETGSSRWLHSFHASKNWIEKAQYIIKRSERQLDNRAFGDPVCPDWILSNPKVAVYELLKVYDRHERAWYRHGQINPYNMSYVRPELDMELLNKVDDVEQIQLALRDSLSV